jgi:hypothetical protein
VAAPANSKNPKAKNRFINILLRAVIDPHGLGNIGGSLKPKAFRYPAKFCTNAICLSENGRASSRRTKTAPMAASSRSRGTPSVARWPKKNGSARRLGGIRFLTGLLSFFAICSVGVIANVSIAAAVFQQHYAW